MDDGKATSLEKIVQYNRKGKYQDSLKLIEEIENSTDIIFDKEEELEFLYLQSRTLEQLGKLDISEIAANHLLEKSIEANNEIYHIKGSIAKIYAIMRGGQIADAQDLITKTEQLILHYEDTENLAFLDVAGLFWNLSSIFHHIAGNFEKAEIFQEKSYNYRMQIGNPADIAMSLNNLGFIHGAVGQLDKALEFHKKSYEIRKNLGNKRDMAMSLNNIGSVYLARGLSQLALEYLLPSLQFRQIIGDDGLTSETYFHIINALVDEKNIHNNVLLPDFVKNLDEIAARNLSNRTINIRNKLSQAVYLKSTKIVENINKSHVILNEVITEDIVDYQLTVFGLLALCELLLEEFIFTSTKDAFEKAVESSYQMYKLAQKKKSFFLIVEALILQSKFALLEGKIDSCSSFLQLAKEVADENNLLHMVDKVRIEQSRLTYEFSKWDEMHRDGVPLNERMKMMKLEEYMRAAKEVTRLL